MKEYDIYSLTEFISYIEDIQKSVFSEILYRGQSSNYTLLPSIARKNPSKDTTEIEKEMLMEFKRRIAYKNIGINNDWDLLVYAQHFGMKTRLLDWTTNPLVALYFACYKLENNKKLPCVFVLKVKESEILDRDKEESPFVGRKKTRVFKPAINNERLRIQSGWFTAHKYWKIKNTFVPLEKNIDIKGNINIINIKCAKDDIIRHLNYLSINYEKLFPDASGICHQINYDVFGEY